mmetsp:Transcript_36413/g.97842  ORF Transcript_36413/g.97842 Transcript_36413/m.97842 type:complete len:99 (-) Transcript_36413:563-859(-)
MPEARPLGLGLGLRRLARPELRGTAGGCSCATSTGGASALLLELADVLPKLPPGDFVGGAVAAREISSPNDVGGFRGFKDALPPIVSAGSIGSSLSWA